jgi:Zn-finger nucleic acid-binding protein
MHCPVDKRPLRRVELEAGLSAFECDACAGHWLRFGEYLRWRDRQRGDTPEVPPEVEPDADPYASAGGVRRCPDCEYLLTRFRVGHDVPFALDRCGNCNGVWLDRAEWETLRARGLHDNLHQMFGPGWQHAVRTEEQQRRLAAQFERQLGAADFARAREFAAWLATHPRRSQIFAYLQSQVREKAAGGA